MIWTGAADIKIGISRQVQEYVRREKKLLGQEITIWKFILWARKEELKGILFRPKPKWEKR